MLIIINVNRLNLIARSIYFTVSYKYIFVIGPYTLLKCNFYSTFS